MCIFAGGMHVSAKERECFEVDLETLWLNIIKLRD